MRKLFGLLVSVGILLAIVGIAALAPTEHTAKAASVTIDSFTTSHDARVCPEIGPLSDTSVASASEALGGERDVYVETTADDLSNNTNCMFVGVNPLSDTHFSSIVQIGVTGSAEVQWDGTDGDATSLDATGLGGVDLTDGGLNDAFFMRILDNNSGIPSMDVTVYTDATNYSTYTLSLGLIINPENRKFRFSDFSAAGGSGADFTNVGAITWSFDAGPGQSGPNVEVFEARPFDTTPPESTANLSGTPGDNGWYQSDVDVTLSATDNDSGVDRIEYRVDGGAWATYNSPFTVAGDGTHTVEFFATDNSGNTETTNSVNVDIDTADPSSTATIDGTVGGDGWYVSVVEVELSATDATSGVDQIRYRIDGGLYQTYSGPITLDTSGEWDLEYLAIDEAGNAESVNSETIRIDRVEPQTQALPGGVQGDNDWYVTPVEVSLSANDEHSGVDGISYSVDGAPTQTYSGPFTIDTDGIHQIDYFATDNAGNIEATKTISVKIDTTEPQVVDGGPYEVGEGQSITLDASSSTDATSGVASIEWDLDADTSYESGNPTAFSHADGPDTIAVGLRVTDNAGNTSETTVDVTVTNLPPTIDDVTVVGTSITVSASDPAGNLDTLSYSFDCDDNNTFEIGPQASNSTDCDFGSNEGALTVNVLVQDGDGGEAQGSGTVVIQSDLCANRYNGELRYSRHGSCASTEVALTLPGDGPLDLCANRYNGDLRYSRTGICASTEWGIVLPDEGPLAVCVNRYNGDMRAARTPGQCASTEFDLTIGN